MSKENPLPLHHWTPQEFIGKTVFDSKSDECGKIQSLYIDPVSYSISGILVKKRLAHAFFLSKDYFDKLGESGLYLNSVPITPNDKVVDTKGKKLGKVVKINHNSETNEIESLEIKSGFKSIIINSEKIVGIGDKVTVQV